MRNRIIIFYLIVVCVCCSTPRQLQKAWVGKSNSDLYKKFGTPAAVTDDGKGGHVLIYSFSDTAQSAARLSTTSNGVITYSSLRRDTITTLRYFYINPAGIIYLCK